MFCGEWWRREMNLIIFSTMQYSRMVFHFSIFRTHIVVFLVVRLRKRNVMTQAMFRIDLKRHTFEHFFSLFLLPNDISKAEAVNSRHAFNYCNDDAPLHVDVLAFLQTRLHSWRRRRIEISKKLVQRFNFFANWANGVCYSIHWFKMDTRS